MEGFISSLVEQDAERILARETAFFSLGAADVDKVLVLARSDLFSFDAVEHGRFLDLTKAALLSLSLLTDILEVECLFVTFTEETLLSTLLFSLDILLGSSSQLPDKELITDDVRLPLNLDLFSSVDFLHVGVLVRRLEGGADILEASGAVNFDEFNRVWFCGDLPSLKSDETLFDFDFTADLVDVGVAITDRGAITLVDFVLLFFARTSLTVGLVADFKSRFL